MADSETRLEKLFKVWPFVSRKKLLALCESWERERYVCFRNSEVCDEKKEGPVTVKQAFFHGAKICNNHVVDLRAAIQPKFSLEFLFKIFRKNTKSPRSSRD